MTVVDNSEQISWTKLHYDLTLPRKIHDISITINVSMHSTVYLVIYTLLLSDY